ncbi:nose resistant to fluoxetine protein 6 [Amyelois transitella]|uniref:nose resistant to fluoxetine protein 6 n=1 Tax=Amyelois transitella TaxID=680683 RepID=UPI0029902831|nr:nose resistant to fluoxetine protein 6 [Amyelois transitella]
MIKNIVLIVSCIISVVINTANARIDFRKPNTVFDQDLYENVLDPELCDQHIKYLRSDLLLNLRFSDAGIRLPRGILVGNSVDLGNYHQCLAIDETRNDLEIKGKYCMIRVPLNQNFEVPGIIGSTQLNYEDDLISREMEKIKGAFNTTWQIINSLNGESDETPATSSRTFRLAVCIPRPCSVEQAMTSALFNLTSIGFQFEEEFCRLPNDKPWSPADYVAVVLLSFIGLLTLLSTCYDLNHTFIQKQDPKNANTLYRSFSIYTNGQRLTTFSPNPNSLQCLDGIRTLAMLWVIVGHTFITENFVINMLDGLQWLTSANALWITVAPYTVDTFFMITGLLLVYTTVGKLTGGKLLKNLHLFYLNRLLRLFPLLGLTVLLQASLLNIIFDGPYWTNVANHVRRCRDHWWATLLHVQNYAAPTTMCISHSWYVAIDVHLHIVSPLVLFWVLSKSRKTAWIALVASLAIIYGTTTYYNAYKEFPGYNVATSYPSHKLQDYMANFYFNSFTRAAPFFVGMIFGNILSIWKEQKPKLHIALVLLLWACTFTLFGLITYSVYQIKQSTWDNLVLDVIKNSYGRSAWAVALGWIILACVHGYAGPINWFLSLDVWKLPARLSYAMFLLHYPFQFTINSTLVAPVFFSVPAYAFKSLAYIAFTFIVSFVACLLIDAPFSVLFKLMLGDGIKKQKPVIEHPEKNGTARIDDKINTKNDS